MISGPSVPSIRPASLPTTARPAIQPQATGAAPVRPQGWSIDLGHPADPRSAWTLMFGAPVGATVGSVIGGVLKGRAGAAVGALVGSLVGCAIGAIPRLWDVIQRKDTDGDIRKQLALLGGVAGSTLVGAKVGRSVGGAKGALIGALLGAAVAVIVPIVTAIVWLIILGLVWGAMGTTGAKQRADEVVAAMRRRLGIWAPHGVTVRT